MPHMVNSNSVTSVVDKRKSLSARADDTSHLTLGPTVFTANGAGTTTTIVGANAAPGTNDNNVIRRGEKFRLFTSAGVLKEETVFEVTGIAVGANTTVTFAPAAAGATASGDFARLTGTQYTQDINSMDDRLAAINGTSYTASRLATMTENDKLYAIRVESDPSGI